MVSHTHHERARCEPLPTPLAFHVSSSLPSKSLTALILTPDTRATPGNPARLDMPLDPLVALTTLAYSCSVAHRHHPHPQLQQQLPLLLVNPPTDLMRQLTKLSCLLLVGMGTYAAPQLSSPTPTRHSNSSSSTMTTSLRPRTTLATE